MALFGSSPLAAAPPTTAEADAIAFGTRPTASAMHLSPDALHAVYIAPGPGRTSQVMVIDLNGGSVKPIMASRGAPEMLRWCSFVSNSRLVCRFTATVDTSGVLANYSRLISVNLDGTDIKQLGQPSSFYDARIRQFDGSILDWRPGDGESVLMERVFVPEEGRTNTRLVEKKDGLGVDRINVRTLQSSEVEPPRDYASGYMTDGLGHVRLMSMPEIKDEGQTLTGRSKYMYRRAGSRTWDVLADYSDADDFEPLAIDATSDSMYVLKKLDGRKALYRIKLNAARSSELVASNPHVDVDSVVRAADGQRVIGYTFAEDKRQVVYFDSEYHALSNALSKAVPNLPMIDFVNASADGGKVLLTAEGDSEPGHYYLFDKASRSLNDLVPTHATLDGRTLASVQPIHYPAADGTMIPAYLTLPLGRTAKNLPAIVLPHGGPSSRDEWGFDWLSQFLAARGYAVIQPNYRGSAGFGDAWLVENGFKGWRTSIGDINAAAHYLASAGIADPKRTAIVGWSYGGYAALQAAETDPSLYKAIVAVAPVTDLALLKTEARDYTNQKMVEKFVGEGPHVIEGSPLRHAAAIAAPVLLVHGDIDTNVNIEHSVKMDAALKASGKSEEFLRFKGLDHQLEDSDARALMLLKMAQLLERTIGH